MTKIPKFGLFTVSLIFLLFLCSCVLEANNIPLDVFPTAIPSRSIEYAQFSLQERWRDFEVLIPYRDNSIFLATENLLIIFDCETDGLTCRMRVLSADTGSLNWETQPLPYSEQYIIVDNERVYLALSTKIIAYDVTTGEVLWETEEKLPYHTQYIMRITENNLIVYSDEEIDESATKKIIRIYNTQNGKLEDSIEEVIPLNVSFVTKTDFSEYWTDRSSIWMLNSQTNQQQWHTLIEGALQYEPLLLNNIFVFASGIFSDIVALDNLNGKQIWKYDKKTVSNLSINSNVIYAVREDAAIVAIDIFTGEEIGYVNMKPEFTEDKMRSLPFLIAVNNDMIFVYYGDSQELIAFSKDLSIHTPNP